jgi:Protein of unknown function (DUF3631)
MVSPAKSNGQIPQMTSEAGLFAHARGEDLAVPPVDRDLALWQGRIAAAASDGKGLDIFREALAYINQNVLPDRGLREHAKAEIWDAAVRHLEESVGLDVLASIYTSVMSEQPPGTDEELDQIALKADERKSHAAEITRAKGLSRIEYDRERRPLAKQLGIRVTTLDDEVAGKDGGNRQGRAVVFQEQVPWTDPVDGAALLDAIAATIRSHVVMPDYLADTTALWVVHTYLLECGAISPRLAITSAEKGSGKTTLVDVVSHLVHRPLTAANVTTAAIFRVVEMHKPTLLIDEADTFLAGNEDLRGILNSGHRRGGTVVRTVGKDFEPREFSTYSACSIALIGKLPSTLEDRSVSIELQRRRSDEPIEPFRFGHTDHLDQLARKAARWAADHAERVRGADPVTPPGLFNRLADNWRPLLAVADAAGKHWPQRARGGTSRHRRRRRRLFRSRDAPGGHLRDLQRKAGRPARIRGLGQDFDFNRGAALGRMGEKRQADHAKRRRQTPQAVQDQAGHRPARCRHGERLQARGLHRCVEPIRRDPNRHTVTTGQRRVFRRFRVRHTA